METKNTTTAQNGYDPLSDAAPNVKEYQKPNVDFSNIQPKLKYGLIQQCFMQINL